jgi:hypothetical protein
MTNELKYQIEKQIRFNLPSDLFHITTKESKTSTYFYAGSEKQLDDFENGREFSDGELLKFRVSDHDAICGASWAHECTLVRYFQKSGYNIEINGGETFDTLDEKEAAKIIVSNFMNYFK